MYLEALLLGLFWVMWRFLQSVSRLNFTIRIGYFNVDDGGKNYPSIAKVENHDIAFKSKLRRIKHNRKSTQVLVLHFQSHDHSFENTCMPQ